MDFISVFKRVIENFELEKIDFAVVGGFALHTAGITRTTKDIDLMILASDLEKTKKIIISCGYELLHESNDVLNFTGKTFELGRIDFLLAHRKYMLAMLAKAKKKDLLDGRFKIKVLNIEDLIGLKIQSSSNDKNRYEQDMADIKTLIKLHFDKLDMSLVKEYFSLFKRENELAIIINEVKNVK